MPRTGRVVLCVAAAATPLGSESVIGYDVVCRVCILFICCWHTHRTREALHGHQTLFVLVRLLFRSLFLQHGVA